MNPTMTTRVISQGSKIHISRGWDSYLKGLRFISQGQNIQCYRVGDSNPKNQNIKCFRVRDFRIGDSNLKGQGFKFYYTFSLQSQGSEIHTSRVGDSNLKGQRFISQELEIQIPRVRDSSLKSQRFISQGSEIHISRVWDSNKYNMLAPPRQTKEIYILIITYMLHIVGIPFYFYLFFFIAITGNMFMCIDINITVVIFSTYLNTTWTTAWHLTVT